MSARSAVSVSSQMKKSLLNAHLALTTPMVTSLASPVPREESAQFASTNTLKTMAVGFRMDTSHPLEPMLS
jgi:hypothetical protein